MDLIERWKRARENTKKALSKIQPNTGHVIFLDFKTGQVISHMYSLPNRNHETDEVPPCLPPQLS